MVRAYEERGHLDLPQPVGNVVHLKERPERIGVADGRQHPVVLEDLLPRRRIELEPSGHVRIGRDGELGHGVHAPLEGHLDALRAHHDILHPQRQAAGRG